MSRIRKLAALAFMLVLGGLISWYVREHATTVSAQEHLGHIIDAALASPADPQGPKTALLYCYDGSYGGQTDGATASVTTPTSRSWIQQWCHWAESNGVRPQKNGANRKQPPSATTGDCAPDYSGAPCQNIFYFEAMKIHPQDQGESDFYSAMRPLSLANDAAFYHKAPPPQYPSDCDSAPNCNRVISRRPPSQCNSPKPVCVYTNTANANVIAWFNSGFRQGGSNPFNPDGGWPPGWYGFSDDSGISCRNIAPVIYELGTGATCDRNHAANLNAFFSGLTFANSAPLLVIANAGWNGTAGTVTMPNVTNINNSLVVAIGVACENCIVDGISSLNVGAIPGVLDGASVIVNHKPARYAIALSGTARLADGSSNACSHNSDASDGKGCGQVQLRMFALAVRLLFPYANYVNWDYWRPGATILDAYPEDQITMPAQRRPIGAYVSDSGAGRNGSGCIMPSGTIDANQVGGAADLRKACGEAYSYGADRAEGVYVQEGTCYNYGALVGPCAAIVNNTDQSFSIASLGLSAAYTHSLTIGTGSPANVHAQCTLHQACPASAINPLGAGAPEAVAPLSGLLLTP